MSKIAMVFDLIRWEEKAIIEAAKKKGVDLALHDAREMFMDLSKNSTEIGDLVLQRCVGYYRKYHLTAALEQTGVTVINGFEQTIRAGNKLMTSLLLSRAGIPTPRTMLAFTPDAAKKALGELGYPAVLKPTVGSWGRLIALLKDEESAEAVLEDREFMFPAYQVYYLQEKVERPPRDIRSFVIGDRVVAAIYRTSGPRDWRTNTARGGKAENCPIDKELEEISLRAARVVGDGIYGIDCMETPNGLVVHEVNNTIEFKNTVPATGIDIPGLIVDYLLTALR